MNITVKAHFGSTVHALYETLLVLLPVAVWSVVLLSTGSSWDDIYHLTAIPFAALALFSAMLRDGISAFHQDTPKDAKERDLVVIAGLIGVTLTTVLLTIGVLFNRQLLPKPPSEYYGIVWFALGAGIALVYTTKHILALRKRYGLYA